MKRGPDYEREDSKGNGEHSKISGKEGSLERTGGGPTGRVRRSEKQRSADPRCDEGPRVKIEVEGAKFSSGDLKKLLPIYQEGAVDEDLLEEGRKTAGATRTPGLF